ncbi:prolyl oligopeptidase family serine peptidase [Streptomyces sp. NBC_00986]|uniref:prolyl oligopeptidase family serine peptidase n=1 Tax=Streptomyces sp. NBC_00986 TaxID=2903702 RepID=UPI003866E59D|nr:alpha/beta hydrolase [Streptomyces sp. NBC_00986]
MDMHGEKAAPQGKTRAGRRRGGAAVTVAITAGLALVACSSGGADSAGSTSSPSAQTATCPTGTADATAGAGAGTPTGMPSGNAGGFTVAKTIRKSDTSTSTVIDPKGAQIRCATSGITTTHDITYSSPTTDGRKSDLKLDIQVPTSTSGKKPLVIYLTGGGFVMADRTANLDQRTYVADQGYVVASVQYRTTKDGATYKDAVADVKSAIRYLRANADTYSIDADQVAVWGQSAGGYLAAMTGATNGEKSFDVGDNLDQSSEVQGVVDEFGPADLSELAADYDTAAQKANYAAGNSAAQWVYGPGTKKSIADRTSEVAAADPATHISPRTAPFVIFHGSADNLVSPSETLNLHTALRAKGIDSIRYVLTGAGHGDLSFTGDTTASLPWSTQETMGHIVDFLGQHLK